MDWNDLADRTLAGHDVTTDEALAALRAPDDDLLPLLHAAFRLRSRHHGRDVGIHVQLQPLGRYPANSLSGAGYLTTPGQGYEADPRMIAGAGFQVSELVEA